jgi:hypothetical protein
MAEPLRPLLEDLRATLRVTVPGKIQETKRVLDSSGRSLARTPELPALCSDLLSRISRQRLHRRHRRNPREVCIKISN